MSVRSRTISRLILAVAGLCALAAPVVAGANPLLSGYGGPGQGAQVIIGGTLLNPPGGGSGGQASAPTAGELTVPGGTGSAAGKSTRSRSGARGHHGRSTAGKGKGSAPAGPVKPTAPVSSGLAQAATSSSGGTLGLSGGQLVLVLFALAALTATGVLTRKLTRRTP